MIRAWPVARGWSVGQGVLRGLIVAGPLVALVATVPAGATPAWWLVGLVAVLAVGFAALPDSPFGSAVLFVVVAWWGIGLHEGLPAEAIVAAGALLTAHLAALVAAYGPGHLPVDPAVARLWLRRGAAVFLTAPAVWAVATALRGQPEPAGIWVAGLAVALVAVVVASLGLGSQREG